MPDRATSAVPPSNPRSDYMLSLMWPQTEDTYGAFMMQIGRQDRRSQDGHVSHNVARHLRPGQSHTMTTTPVDVGHDAVPAVFTAVVATVGGRNVARRPIEDRGHNPRKIEPVMSSLRRCSPILIVVVLAATVTACSSSASTSSNGSSPRSTTTAATASSGSDPATASTTVTSPAPPTRLEVSKLATAGIGVYDDPNQTAPIHEVTTFDGAPTPVRLLATQARAMTLEAADGQGLLGSTIDQLIGADPGMPPPSFLVAGWITGSQSPAALYAHSLMGDQTWRNAPTIVFPTLSSPSTRLTPRSSPTR